MFFPAGQASPTKAIELGHFGQLWPHWEVNPGRIRKINRASARTMSAPPHLSHPHSQTSRQKPSLRANIRLRAPTTTPKPTPTSLPTNRLATLQQCTHCSLCSPALPPGRHCAHICIHCTCTHGHAVMPTCALGTHTNMHAHTGTRAHTYTYGTICTHFP